MRELEFFASEEDIKLFLQTMNYEKELCYEKDEFVEGIELVHTSIQRIEEYIRELRRVYLSSLNSEQLNILRDLQNSLYIEEFKRYYQHLHSISQLITQWGFCQLDDVVTNTVGAFVGWIIWNCGNYFIELWGNNLG